MSFVTTTTRNKPKAWAWSYSRVKNYRTCPKRHFHIDIKRDVVEEKSDALLYGDFVHKALAERIEKGTEIPEMHRGLLEPWAAKVLAGPGKVLVENKLAITDQFAPCTYFANDCWFRTIADVIKLNGPVAVVIDWKSGKVLEDSVQLALIAAVVFAHYPEIQAIRTEFVWLKEDAVTRADFRRSDVPAIWAGILPEVQLLKHASDTMTFPPKPSGLCKRFCPVRQCPHHGEGR